MARVSVDGGALAKPWPELALRSRRALLRFVRLQLPGPHVPVGLVEDLVQETYLEAWRKRENFHGQSPEDFFAWLSRIARFKARNHLRREVLRSGPEEGSSEEGGPDRPAREPLSRDPGPEAALRARESGDWIQRALGTLSDPAKDLVVAVYFRGITVAAWAREAGMGYSTASKTLKRAVGELRPKLRKDLL